MGRLADRVAVVTGAGRGIGAATAVALAQAGADVVISARTEDQLATVAREVEAAGRRAVVVPADLSDPGAAAGLAPAAVEAFGRLDIVVNNVGGAMPRPFLATTPRHLENAFRFNVVVAHNWDKAIVVLSGWREQGIQVVDLKTRQVTQTLLQNGAFYGAAFSSDGRIA